MGLKFYLNKFAKVDNIEHYSFNTILELQKTYEEYIEHSEGQDPDFPMLTFGGYGGSGGKKVKGKNIAQVGDGEQRLSSDNDSNEIL